MRLKTISSIRANNADSDLALKIGNLWEEANGIIDHNDIIRYGVYDEYESNYMGDFSYHIAIESDEDPDIIIENSNYKIYKADKIDNILTVWKTIWAEENQEIINRAYLGYDFEKYLPDGTVEIYIKLKE